MPPWIQLRSLRVCLSVVLTVCTIAVPATSQQPDSIPESFGDDRIAQGRDIAKGGAQAGGVDMKCMACHGLDGKGDGVVPRLAALPYDYLTSQIDAFIDGARDSNVMAPVAMRLLPHERASVLAYYASLPAPDNSPPPVGIDWDLVSAGELLAYAGGETSEGAEVTACIMCHNAVGSLEQVALAPPLEGQPAAYIRTQLTAWKNGARGGDPLGVMKRVADALSETEIAAVAAFYASRNPADTESE